jgi:endonuclease YncB( thermonuclease family)
MARREHHAVAALLPGITLVLAALAVEAAAQTAPDANTVRLNAVTYRLWAIDAPDLPQTCEGGWPAGQRAAQALAELMRGRTVICEARAKDRTGTTVALCRADGQDLGAAMVSVGMALAALEVSRDYLAAEERAKVARLGVHAHGCKTPWEWRKNVAKSRRDESQ